MGNAANMIGVFDALESRNLLVNQHRCVRVRNRNATCRNCADACTSGCISFAENTLVIQEDKCVGCGTCSTVCPTCALLANQPGDAELLQMARRAMAQNNGHVVLAAQPVLALRAGHYDPAKVVPVVNLGRVEETLLVSLARAGAQSIILVQPAVMDDAEVKGLQTAQVVCATANDILGIWGSECRAQIAEELPVQVLAEMEPQEPSEAPQDVSDEPAAKAEVGERKHMHVMADGTLPHFLPDRREHLLDALYDLGDPADVTMTTRLWGHVLIDCDKCLGCRMCATFCPTGALFKFADPDGTTGIEHAPGDCVKCRCCQDICPAGALTICDEVRAADVVAGTVDRYAMPPEMLRRTDSHSILHALKDLGIKKICEH